MKPNPGQPMSNEDLERLVSIELVAGRDFVYGADNIAAERDRNYDYYRGIMNDLPAPPGRSKVVEHTVANYIGLMKPNLLRIFTSGRNIAEYVSPKPEMQPMVKLITRFINDVVFRKDNRGELLLGDWAEDGLVQKLGIAMWWWDECWESKDEVIEGLTDDQMLLLAQEAAARGAEIVEHSASEVIAQTPAGAMASQVHAVKVRTRVNKSKCCIDVIPPEEFVISRDARTLEGAVLKAHRTGVTVGDLLKAGYDYDVVSSLPTYSVTYSEGLQKYNQDLQTNRTNVDQADPMLRKVTVVRGIVHCDFDGTGLKDWYFVMGGDDNAPKTLEIAPYNDQIGFADFCPEPMPHTVYGRCPADRLAAIQKVQTVLTRALLDGTYLHLSPQREVVMDWIVKPDQLMNMAPGAPVLVKQPNAIREMTVAYVGDKALLAINHFDGQAEITTGISKMSAGLDPDVLQNQSATAAMNQQSAMMGRIEMIARIWAQGGMRKLFRGVFKCIKAYQDFARVVQIDGAPQTIDPRAWQGLDDLDVNINTGLGTGNRAQEFGMLTGLKAMQDELIAQLGPNNPIVTPSMAVRMRQMIAQAGGVSYPENIFRDPGENFQVPPPASPQPTPDALVFADVEKFKATVKVQSDEKVTLAKLENDRLIAIRKAELEFALKQEELGIKRAGTLVAAAKVDADREKNDAMHEAREGAD